MDRTDAWMKSLNCPKLVSECREKSFDRETERRTSRRNVGTQPICNGVHFNNVYGVPIVRLTPGDEQCLKPITEQMHSELASGALATSEILVSYLKIFLIKTTRMKFAQDGRTTNTFAPWIPPILDRLTKLIEQHYRSKHRPADYARMVGMNPQALGKLTRTYLHKTLTDLIRERILRHAKCSYFIHCDL
jgi:AraC family transcriptional regulator, transcriptional activator of pobA